MSWYAINNKRGNSVRLVGKTALVTGASRNIGKEISLAFARQGADIALSALRNEDDLKEVSEQCQGLGVKTYSRLADLSDSNQCRELVDTSIEALGKIDILVCNAAVRPHHPLLTVTDEDWRRIFAINLDSSFYLTRSVIPNMIERQNGSIIAIGGASALIGRPSTSAVAASKTGLWGFIRSVASEFAQHNIRANMINPGTIDTARNNPEWSERFLQGTWNTDESVQKIPLRRLGRVEDIANACVFLASDESSYITGDQLNVVGGKYTVATEG